MKPGITSLYALALAMIYKFIMYLIKDFVLVIHNPWRWPMNSQNLSSSSTSTANPNFRWGRESPLLYALALAMIQNFIIHLSRDLAVVIHNPTRRSIYSQNLSGSWTSFFLHQKHLSRASIFNLPEFSLTKHLLSTISFRDRVKIQLLK
jgi:hypothetical protein